MNKTREYKYEGDILYLKCTQCLERYTIDNYPKDKSKRFGVRSDCRDCYRVLRKPYHEKWYEDNKKEQKKYFKEYHENNRNQILERCKNKVRDHTKAIGFDRYKFHAKAKRYAKIHNLRPKLCSICGKSENIEMHHPSYETFDEWSKVIFCCKKCHKNIHNGHLECPNPINLLECVSPLKESSQES